MNTTVHGILSVVLYSTKFEVRDELKGEVLAEGTVYDFYHDEFDTEKDFQDLGSMTVYVATIEDDTLIIGV